MLKWNDANFYQAIDEKGKKSENEIRKREKDRYPSKDELFFANLFSHIKTIVNA